MARRGKLFGLLGDISSFDQELTGRLPADGVLYFAPPDDAVSSPDFYGAGLGLQPWPMLPAGFGTYFAPSAYAWMGDSWALAAVVAPGQDVGAPMGQEAAGSANTIQGVPNDARYTDGSLWGMYGDASSPANQFGSQAAEAWAQGHTGSMANVMGVIDTGIDYTHPDLYLNIWLNQREIPISLRASLSDIDSDGLITFRDLNGSANASYVLDYNGNGRIDAGDLLNDIRWENGVDEDGNGYRDDLIGWDFVNNDNDPMDGYGHGTHVAGTIGAMGDNDIGVVGVNWNVQLVPLQIFSSTGRFAGGTAAINYFTAAAISARAAGSVENFVATNNSWGGGWYDQAILDAITAAARQDILFVAASGNDSSNNDNWSFYPSTYSTAPVTGYEAVISVAAITSGGSLSDFSNFGATSVDIAAPGSEIWSTLPNGQYESWNGTSMAAPHVAGAIALYASLFPNATGAQIREALLQSATFTASINDLVASDARLNIPAMLAITPPVTAFADWLDGTNNAETLNGLGGNDTLDGGLGADSLIGDAGIDLVSYAGATGAVTVSLASNRAGGAAGADSLSGFENVLGGNAADSLLGDAASNQLMGGNGADTLDGWLGADSLIGGAGNDLFVVTDTLDRIIETANGGVDTILTSVSMTMPDHIEALRIAADVSGVTLTGGTGNDMLIGNALSNSFNGAAGDDVILAGNVTLADIYALFAA
jgi:subtilisin family serine protease